MERSEGFEATCQILHSVAVAAAMERCLSLLCTLNQAATDHKRLRYGRKPFMTDSLQRQRRISHHSRHLPRRVPGLRCAHRQSENHLHHITALCPAGQTRINRNPFNPTLRRRRMMGVHRPKVASLSLVQVPASLDFVMANMCKLYLQTAACFAIHPDRQLWSFILSTSKTFCLICQAHESCWC